MKLRGAVLVALLLLWAAPAFSQGCAMCSSSAQAASKDGQRAIGKGVIVLLVPPLGFMTLGVWMACRYARKRDLEKVTFASSSREKAGNFEILLGHAPNPSPQQRVPL
jgi:hypothetical protein